MPRRRDGGFLDHVVCLRVRQPGLNGKVAHEFAVDAAELLPALRIILRFDLEAIIALERCMAAWAYRFSVRNSRLRRLSDSRMIRGPEALIPGNNKHKDRLV